MEGARGQPLDMMRSILPRGRCGPSRGEQHEPCRRTEEQRPEGDAAESEPGSEEQSFFSHLVELRERLLKAIAAVGIVLLGLLHFFWMRSAKRRFGEVAVYAAVIGVLLLWRLWKRSRRATATS